jgi:hypothetical protein
MDKLRVYTFMPGWGLPTTGPFALKLLAWLCAEGIDHEQVIENRSGKGPLGKSPWIERDGRRVGDSDAIIRALAAERGLADPTRAATPEEAAAQALRLAFEERFHQVLEWELFLHPAGAKGMRAMVRSALPPVVSNAVFISMQRHFRRQLQARGMGRLSPAKIEAEGRALLDLLRLVIRPEGWLWPGGPGLPDFAVWGQVAPLMHWPMRTPVAETVKADAAVARWAARVAHAAGVTAAAQAA